MNASLLVSVLGVDISKVIAGFEGPKYNPSVHTLHFFIERNNVKGIEWLRKLGVGDPWDEWACIKAAENGLDNQGDLRARLLSTCFDCLKYLHENGCPWDRWTCSKAAGEGHLDCLRYAHENGCDWDRWTCSNAAAGGDLDCLRYLHENGCPWHASTCSAAAL